MPARNPVRILFASWYTGLGGGETDLLSLADALDPQAYTPHLLLPDSGGQLAQAWSDRGWPVHTLAYRGATTWFVPFIWRFFPVVNKMTQLLQDEHIDLIHSDYHTLPLIAPAASRADVPCMWTVHGWWFQPKPWQRAFFRQIPAVARSHSIRDGFLGEPPFMPPEILPVIYSGVDSSRFHPGVDGSQVRDEIDVAADTPLVALVARFQSVKGHHIFQKMALQVALQQPDARFIVAGEDVFGVAADADYKREILQRADQEPLLKERLTYIGFRDDVERVLAAADVVVCASEFESYGKVNLEAMACATPVVSTNQGGPAETIVPDETGYLVPPNDPGALAERVLYLLRHPAERQRLGANGRRRVREHFSAETSARLYRAFFLSLLKTHPSSAAE